MGRAHCEQSLTVLEQLPGETEEEREQRRKDEQRRAARIRMNEQQRVRCCVAFAWCDDAVTMAAACVVHAHELHSWRI